MSTKSWLLAESRWLHSRIVINLGLDCWNCSCLLSCSERCYGLYLFCFLRQPFSQVIIFIDWSEDTQYPEGPADDHFKFRRNSLLMLLFLLFCRFWLVSLCEVFVRALPRAVTAPLFSSPSLLTLLFSTTLFLSILPPYSFILSFQSRMFFYLLQPMPLTAF